MFFFAYDMSVPFEEIFSAIIIRRSFDLTNFKTNPLSSIKLEYTNDDVDKTYIYVTFCKLFNLLKPGIFLP